MNRAAITALAVVASLCGQTASAEQMTAGSRERAKIFSSQAKFLDSRASTQYSYSTRLQPQSDLPKTLNLPGRKASRYKGSYLPMAEEAARRHRVPVSLFTRLVEQESNWNASAQSGKGAIGLAQLMPDTARMLGVDPLDPQQNLSGGARYLRQQYDKFGSWQLALAAYNAGPGAVEKHNGVPPYDETRNYVQAILGFPG